MNIESKRFSIRSASNGIPGADVWDKRARRGVLVPLSDLPSVAAMGAMSESAFDRMAAGLMATGPR
jgi:hypothetical protein